MSSNKKGSWLQKCDFSGGMSGYINSLSSLEKPQKKNMKVWGLQGVESADQPELGSPLREDQGLLGDIQDFPLH